MPKTILVCDDDPLLVAIVKFRLESRGYDVDVAIHGGDALERIVARKPDAIARQHDLHVLPGKASLPEAAGGSCFTPAKKGQFHAVPIRYASTALWLSTKLNSCCVSRGAILNA